MGAKQARPAQRGTGDDAEKRLPCDLTGDVIKLWKVHAGAGDESTSASEDGHHLEDALDSIGRDWTLYVAQGRFDRSKLKAAASSEIGAIPRDLAKALASSPTVSVVQYSPGTRAPTLGGRTSCTGDWQMITDPDQIEAWKEGVKHGTQVFQVKGKQGTLLLATPNKRRSDLVGQKAAAAAAARRIKDTERAEEAAARAANRQRREAEAEAAQAQRDKDEEARVQAAEQLAALKPHQQFGNGYGNATDNDAGKALYASSDMGGRWRRHRVAEVARALM